MKKMEKIIEKIKNKIEKMMMLMAFDAAETSKIGAKYGEAVSELSEPVIKLNYLRFITKAIRKRKNELLSSIRKEIKVGKIYTDCEISYILGKIYSKYNIEEGTEKDNNTVLRKAFADHKIGRRTMKQGRSKRSGFVIN